MSKASSALATLRNDASLLVGAEHVHSVKGNKARIRVQPSSTAEITQLILLAHKREAAILPVGYARRLDQNSEAPQKIAILLDLLRLDQILHLDYESKIVRVQAGLRASQLEETLRKRRLTLGDFPSTILRSSIGGLLSVRTAGKSSRRHGTLEDAVVGISAILANGQSIHTRVAPRRASGPDLARAICGSEGSLGVITDATLRIHHRPETELVALWALPTLTDALQAVRLALREECNPARCSVYNLASFQEHVQDLSALPEGTQAVVATITSGPTDLAHCDRELIQSASQVAGGSRLPHSLAKEWWKEIKRRDKTDEVETPTLQLSVSPGLQRPVVRAILDEAENQKISCTLHASQFDFDGAVFYVDLRGLDKEALVSGAPQIEAVAHAAEQAGAFLSASLPPRLGTYLEALKADLDPKQIFSLGMLKEELR